MKTRFLFLLIGSLLFMSIPAKSIDFNGVYTIGASGTYSNLTVLSNALKTTSGNSVTGNCIFEILSDYNYSSETYPIVFKEFSSTGNYTVTIRPQAGVGSVLTAGSSTSAIISFDEADHFALDGRAGGAGSAVWTIRNTRSSSTYGSAIRFINGATYNAISYLIVESQNASTSGGNIVFNGTNNTMGNSFNTISYCQIRNRSDIGGTSHNNGIYANGNATYPNTNNTITECEFFNHFRANASTYGIYLTGGNTDYSITNNKIFQPNILTFTTGALHMGIRVNNSSGNNFTITGNSIGYANASSTGVYEMVGDVATRFVGIYLTVGSTTVTSVQDNVIAGIELTTTSTSTSGYGVFSGIYVTSGKLNIGTILPNIIGDSTTIGNISIIKNISSTALTLVKGISASTTSTINISNNAVGGISFTSPYAESGLYLSGISTSGTNGNYTISQNKMGSIISTNNLQIGVNGVTTGQGRFMGINNSATGTVVIEGNSVSNFTNYCQGDNYTYGIYVSSGIASVNENRVFNLTTHSSRVGSVTSPSIGGILKGSTVAGIHSLNENRVYNLHSTHTTAATIITGLYFNGPISYVSEISDNQIYNLTAATTSTSAIIYGLYVNGGDGLASRNFIHSLSTSTGATRLMGIRVASGTMSFYNNRVRLGIDIDGNSITTATNIWGIYKSSSGSNNFYFNTVFIGGSGVGSTATNTMAFYRSVNSTVDNIQNNIFVNNRSNATTGGNHFCYVLNGTSMASVDYNLYYANGVGGKHSSLNNGSTVRTTLLNTRENFNNQDLHSGYGDPNFVNATGNLAALNLDLTGTTPAEASGLIISGISSDFNQDTRSSLSPTDMGSDAGNFTALDIFTPNIIFNPLSNTNSTSDRTLSGVLISDIGQGVPTSGSYRPAIWYRISSASPTAWVYNLGTLSSGNGNDGEWSFTLDYSKLSRTVATNDVIQYYITVQDQASSPNIWYSPFIGANHSDVITQVSAPTTPRSYTVSGSYMSGTYTIGTGGDFSTLTGTGGFFATVNSSTVNGDINLVIISDITETGANALNALATDGPSYSLSISPNSATQRSITGSYNGALIRLNGADSVFIDGRFAGNGNYLRFYNTSSGTGSGALSFINGATKNRVQYCTFEGGASQYTILFSTSNAGYGNNDNIIDNNIIRDRLSITSIPTYAIYSNGTGTDGYENMSNIISNNEIYNFGTSGVYIGATGNGNDWIINANHFYNNQSTPPAVNQYVIYLASANVNNAQITNNFIGGQAANCGGSAWENTGAGNFYGIYISNHGSVNASIIDNNTISNIRLSNVGSAVFTGIFKNAGLVNIGTTYGNRIGSPTIASSVLIDGTGAAYGMRIEAGESEIRHNIIANIEQSGTTVGNMAGIHVNSLSNIIIEKNRIYKIGPSTGVATTISIYGIRLANSGSASGYLIMNNQIALGQNAFANSQAIYGLYIANGSGGLIQIFNNSFYITGTVSASSYRSAALHKNSSCNLDLMNNLFYLDRQGNGSQNIPIVLANTSGTIESNYNLLIGSNASEMGRYGSTNYSFANFQNTSGKDKQSWSETSSNVAAGDLFVDATNCNLAIIDDNPECWLANGNGIALTEVATDFDGNLRITDAADGSTDIGAFEFENSPSNEPPLAIESGTIAVGNTTTYTVGGRVVATIEWNSGTALPTSIEVQYFSGIAYDLPSSAPMYGYTIINQTGGTDFNYDLILPFSDALVGLIDNPSEISIAKSSDGENWTEEIGSVNYAARTIRISDLNSFSIFNVVAAGDLEESVLPVQLLNFQGKRVDNQVLLNWTTASELNNDYFIIQRSDDLNTFFDLNRVNGNGSTNSIHHYSFSDENPKLGANYYRLISVDFDGQQHFSKILSVVFSQANMAILSTEFGLSISFNESNDQDYLIEIYDLSGKLLYKEKYFANEGSVKTIRLDHLPNGLFFVRLSSNFQVQTMKFLR